MGKIAVPATKKLMGVLAVIALMSVLLAKFFSDLAFADADHKQAISALTQTTESE